MAIENSKLSYWALRKKLKDMDLSTTGNYDILAERFAKRQAQILANKKRKKVKLVKPLVQKENPIEKEVQSADVKVENAATIKSIKVPVKLNKRNKTPEQVKKDNEAAAGLAACGRL